jgi:putative integral membrane protein (TIGR02587 family)
MLPARAICGQGRPDAATTLLMLAHGVVCLVDAAWHRTVRSTGSALVFGVALLYTMEAWWDGLELSLAQNGLFLGASLLLCLFLGRYGFNDKDDWRGVFVEAGEALLIGCVLSVVCLLTLALAGPGYPMRANVGTILVMTIPFTLGAFLADKILPFLGSRMMNGNGGWLDQTLRDAAATIAGGLFLGLPVLPTDEVPLMAIGMAYPHQMALMALSLLSSYIIVFASRSRKEPNAAPLLGRPLAETMFCYAVSLLLALALLGFVGRITSQTPMSFAFAQAVTLAFPLTVGGAAGRLAA